MPQEIRKCKWCDKPAKKYYQGTRDDELINNMYKYLKGEM